MAEQHRHPATGQPIEVGPDEQLQQIAWPGPLVLVVTAVRPTYRCPEGEPTYRLASAACKTWNPIGAMQLSPWPPV